MKLQKSKGSVWDDIAADPAEAAQLKFKAALFDAIRAYINPDYSSGGEIIAQRFVFTRDYLNVPNTY